MMTKPRIAMACIMFLAAAFMLPCIYFAGEYRDMRDREARGAVLLRELKRIDAITDDNAAVAAYKKLSPALPEIQLRIVQRQWRGALEMLQYMQRAGNNAELRSKVDVYGVRLGKLLDEIIDRCNGMLADTASLRPDIAWQLHNTVGASKVLSALVMLETEKNLDKVQGVMREALTAFKASIEAADKAGEPPSRRNIPRWNFEVLSGEGSVQKYEVSATDMDKNQALKENLETLIPEIGGYAPGEPVETRVKK